MNAIKMKGHRIEKIEIIEKIERFEKIDNTFKI